MSYVEAVHLRNIGRKNSKDGKESSCSVFHSNLAWLQRGIAHGCVPWIRRSSSADIDTCPMTTAALARARARDPLDYSLKAFSHKQARSPGVVSSEHSLRMPCGMTQALRRACSACVPRNAGREARSRIASSSTAASHRCCAVQIYLIYYMIDL